MEFSYIGDELAIFQHAVNWKRYFAQFIKPYLGNNILEVGAGNGATTVILCSGREQTWTCLEPDPELAAEIERKILDNDLPSICRVETRELSDLQPSEQFDSILYIDVLEHIEDDRREIVSAVEHLRPDGHLIVLSPAHQFLYTPFDKAIGHYRRYSKSSLATVIPDSVEQRRLIYLDSVGALASLANKAALRQSMPTLNQILFWDRWLVRFSRIGDPLLAYTLGKSILGIWRKKRA